MVEDDMPLVTIVVPAYNVERYLDECVDSIVRQTYPKLQIILVDDGSKDATGKLCDTWADRDARVSVIHSENHGLSAARNAGFAQAAGDWIWFVDSDDCITHDAVEKIVRMLAVHDCELIAIGITPFDATGDLPLETLGFEPFSHKDATSGLELEKALFEGRRGHYTPTYIFNTTVLRGYRSDSGPFDSSILLFEDVAFIHQLLKHVNTVVWIDDPLYRYRQTPGSLVHQGNANRASSGLRTIEIVNNLELAPELEADRKQMLIRFILCIDTLAGDSQEAAEVRKKARSMLKCVLQKEPRVSLPMGCKAKCMLARLGLYHSVRKGLIRIGAVKPWDVA